MAKSIAITGALRLSDTLRTQIEALGLEVLYIQNELERVDDLYTDVDMVICNGLFLHNDIDRFASLKYIQVTSAGLDRLPMDKIADRSIVLHNARGVYSIPMAEWALSGILSLYKNSFHFTQNKLQKEWCKDRDIIELYAKRALVVGFGSVGVEVTKRLYAMGVSVDAVDKFDVSSEYVNANYLISQLFDIAPRYDIIILTLPLTDETYHLFNGEFFSIVKRGA
ncbi:MAG: NAD(P)-dependent oxidoreductase, partial [Rikenellaceae bacterium]